MDQHTPRILIADDNEEMRLYLQHILKREGWEVVEAVDGEQALQRFQEGRFDLVLLDGVMPKLDGFTVCEKIRALAAGQKVPIIMVTALDDSKSVDLAFEAGASEYITKPVHWNFLLQRVAHLLTASQAEARIAAAAARMQAIIETAIDGIITISESGIIEEFNPAAERAFGYPAGEVVGRNFGMLLPEPFRSTLDGNLKNYLKTGQKRLIGSIQEVQGLRKDDTTFPLEFSLSEVLLPGKRLFTTIVRDISERKKAEDAIRKSEASLQEAQRIAHLGNWDWDISRNELHWSDEIYRIFGLAPQSFPGTYEAFLASVHPDDRKPVQEAVNRSLAGSEPYDLVHRIVLPDGTGRMVHEQGEVFRDESGSPTRMVGTVHDVTREKLLAQRLQEYSEGLEQKVRERTAEYEEQKIKAERANQIKSEFLANVTHELKTPLNAIIGFAEILQQEMLGPLNEEQKDLINDVVDSGRDLHEMVSGLLQVASLEKESAELRQQDFYPAQMLAAVVEHYLKKAEAKGLQIEVEVAAEISEIHGDEGKVRDVVMVLLSNAVKFSPAGETVRVIVRQGADQVEICVVDTGPGIAREDQDRLFQPFTQLDSTFTKKHGGTGMGLYLARKLVEVHGGRIWVESAIGAGSKFCFTLPQPDRQRP
ncbi:MAG: PAS domain S-box protein [Proteobacteria bacterium]|nr:PAS domain S-box protein [Pseudomonadota bacterium]MBU1649193.1 PAS domain S-box protein [Pseudomonadota bacterium]